MLMGWQKKIDWQSTAIASNNVSGVLQQMRNKILDVLEIVKDRRLYPLRSEASDPDDFSFEFVAYFEDRDRIEGRIPRIGGAAGI